MSENILQSEDRSGIYDITVTNESDEIIAEFRGTSRTIKGKYLPQQAE